MLVYQKIQYSAIGQNHHYRYYIKMSVFNRVPMHRHCAQYFSLIGSAAVPAVMILLDVSVLQMGPSERMKMISRSLFQFWDSQPP